MQRMITIMDIGICKKQYYVQKDVIRHVLPLHSAYTFVYVQYLTDETDP